MKLMPLVGHKHPALHRPAEPVEDRQHAAWLAKRMMATLAASRNGMALAAPQVGHSLRLVVVKSGTTVVPPRTVILNPTVVPIGDDTESGLEGCLTLPDRWFRVPRHRQVSMFGQDIAGQPVSTTIEGLEARMWQHEVDHLDGLLVLGRFEEVPVEHTAEVGRRRGR